MGVFVGYILARSRSCRDHLGSLSSFGLALGVVWFIRVCWRPWGCQLVGWILSGAPWGSSG